MLPFRLLLLDLLLLLPLLLLSFCLAAILSPKAPLARVLCSEGVLVDADADAVFAGGGVLAAVVEAATVVSTESAVVVAAAFGLRNEVLVPKGALTFFIRANFFSCET